MGVLRVGRDMFGGGSSRTTTLHGDLGREKIFLLGLVSSPKSNGAAALGTAVNTLGSGIGVNIVRTSVSDSISTGGVTRAKIGSVRLRANKVYRLSTRVAERNLRKLGASSIRLTVLRGINGLIYPTRFSAKTIGGTVVLSIPRNSSGPLGCPLVFSVYSIILVGGVSILPCFSFSIRGYGRCIGGEGPGTGIFLVYTGANRNVSR